MKYQLTVEEANGILARAEEEGFSGQSRINPVFTKKQMHDILSNGIAHLGEGRPMIDSLVSRNIQREFG